MVYLRRSSATLARISALSSALSTSVPRSSPEPDALLDRSCLPLLFSVVGGGRSGVRVSVVVVDHLHVAVVVRRLSVWNRGLWVTVALVGARFRCLVRPFLDPETLDAMWITHSSFFTIRRRMSNQLALQLCACRVVVGVDKALIISLAMRFKASPHACIGVMSLAASSLTVSHPPMSFAAASHTRFTMTVTNSLKRPGRVLANC